MTRPTPAADTLPAAPPAVDPETVRRLLDGAVAGLPPWRRRGARRELLGYIEDTLNDLLQEGYAPADAAYTLARRFGDPGSVADGFRALPPARWSRGVRRSGGPLSAVVLGLVLGLALVQVRGGPSDPPAATFAGDLLPALATVEGPTHARMAAMHVREVSALTAPLDVASSSADTSIRVASRFGVIGSSPRVLEPSLPALSPTWLPEGYDRNGVPFLTASATVHYFAARDDRPGIMVEVLRPDRSTVFQIKERHVFPVYVGGLPGFYIDGEWEIRGPEGEQAAPPAWRTDRSRTLLFARDGLLVLVAGPATALDVEDLLRIARSLH